MKRERKMEEAEDDREKRRRALVCKIEALLADWRKCPRGACRRKRGCAPPNSGCLSMPAGEPLTPEQQEANYAAFLQALKRRAAALGMK